MYDMLKIHFYDVFIKFLINVECNAVINKISTQKTQIKDGHLIGYLIGKTNFRRVFGKTNFKIIKRLST